MDEHNIIGKNEFVWTSWHKKRESKTVMLHHALIGVIIKGNSAELDSCPMVGYRTPAKFQKTLFPLVDIVNLKDSRSTARTTSVVSAPIRWGNPWKEIQITHSFPTERIWNRYKVMKTLLQRRAKYYVRLRLTCKIDYRHWTSFYEKSIRT